MACNSFHAGGDFCRLLITFTNSLDPDQDRHVGPDLDPNRLALKVFQKRIFCKKLILKKDSRRQNQDAKR